jgi:hypothetical protein
MAEVEEKKTVEQPMEQSPSLVRPPSFVKLYATNTYVTNTDSDFRIELFNEKFQTEHGWVFQSEAMVILTKEAAKKMMLELTEKIKTYEKEHGEIPVSEERMKFKYFI